MPSAGQSSLSGWLIRTPSTTATADVGVLDILCCVACSAGEIRRRFPAPRSIVPDGGAHRRAAGLGLEQRAADCGTGALAGVEGPGGGLGGPLLGGLGGHPRRRVAGRKRLLRLLGDRVLVRGAAGRWGGPAAAEPHQR